MDNNKNGVKTIFVYILKKGDVIMDLKPFKNKNPIGEVEVLSSWYKLDPTGYIDYFSNSKIYILVNVDNPIGHILNCCNHSGAVLSSAFSDYESYWLWRKLSFSKCTCASNIKEMTEMKELADKLNLPHFDIREPDIDYAWLTTVFFPINTCEKKYDRFKTLKLFSIEDVKR